jgi:hypothetical protein
MIVKGIVLNYQLSTSLVDMYVRSGNVDYAKFVFVAECETESHHL